MCAYFYCFYVFIEKSSKTTERRSAAILNKKKVFYKIFNLKGKIKIEKKNYDNI